MEVNFKRPSKNPFDSAIQGLCSELRTFLSQVPSSIKERAQEIRLRANLPIAVYAGKDAYYINKLGKPTQRFHTELPVLTPQEILDSFHNCCNYSVYSHQNEIRQGFVTIAGGHRVGICGTAVFEKNDISGIRDISSLNIRISREVLGAADDILQKTNQNVGGTLIVGPPASGKTTVLRDLARQISLSGKKVVVVDERGELGGAFQGACQKDLGLSDILTGFPKGEGILRAIRCLSPELILCDEAGNEQEILAMEEGLNAGVGLITTIHGGNLQEVYRRKQGRRLINSGAFHRVILLENREFPGMVKEVYELGDLNDKNSGLHHRDFGRGSGRVSAGEKALQQNGIFRGISKISF